MSALPDATLHNPDLHYLHRLLRRAGLYKKDFASIIGRSETSVLEWFSGKRPIPYLAQYALECIANRNTENRGQNPVQH